MKNSSYAAIAIVSIIVGVVAIIPQIIYHRPAATIPPTEPYISIELPESSSASAATTSEPTVAAPVPAATSVAKPKKLNTVAKPSSAKASSPYPTRLSIPAIQLSSRVISVNVNSKGEMDVPSGNTNNVGWYAGGVLPGERGAAVMDAHVFAAFKNLNSAMVGDDLYVETADGRRLHFVVRDARVYALSELTPDMLFQQTDERRLNLITCAGSLTADRTTYDHRLVVYTELVN